MLRDAGAAQSVILADVLPLSEDSSCHSHVLAQGIEMGLLKIPLHNICLNTDTVSGNVQVSVCAQRPIKVSMILGNDLAGGKVSPLCEISQVPAVKYSHAEQQFAAVFPACAVTRAQSKKFEDVVELKSTFPTSNKEEGRLDVLLSKLETMVKTETSVTLPLTQEKLVKVQKADDSEYTRRNLVALQSKMKRMFNVKASQREFSPGDKEVLSPLSGAALTARFTGPYLVEKKLMRLCM